MGKVIQFPLVKKTDINMDINNNIDKLQKEQNEILNNWWNMTEEQQNKIFEDYYSNPENLEVYQDV